MWRRVGAIAVCALAIGAANTALAADAANPACAVALDFILGQAGRGKHPTPLVVSAAADVGEIKGYTPDNILQAGWSGVTPSADFAANFLGQAPGGPLDACPDLAPALTRARIASGAEAVARVTANNDDITTLPTYPADVLSLSLPVLSADGRGALLQANVCTAVDTCSGEIVYLERDKAGRWKRVGALPSAPS
ncbi:MAG TPA: hypothetical protein VIJ59_01670 [Caulobacteraceae bacterium]